MELLIQDASPGGFCRKVAYAPGCILHGQQTNQFHRIALLDLQPWGPADACASLDISNCPMKCLVSGFSGACDSIVLCSVPSAEMHPCNACVADRKARHALGMAQLAQADSARGSKKLLAEAKHRSSCSHRLARKAVCPPLQS